MKLTSFLFESLQTTENTFVNVCLVYILRNLKNKTHFFRSLIFIVLFDLFQPIKPFALAGICIYLANLSAEEARHRCVVFYLRKRG
jgi:hypothetical protein